MASGPQGCPTEMDSKTFDASTGSPQPCSPSIPRLSPAHRLVRQDLLPARVSTSFSRTASIGERNVSTCLFASHSFCIVRSTPYVRGGGEGGGGVGSNREEFDDDGAAASDFQQPELKLYKSYLDDRKANIANENDIYMLLTHGYKKHRFTSPAFLSRNKIAGASKKKKASK